MGDPISAIASPIVNLAFEKLASLVHEKYLALAGFEKGVKQLENTLTDILKVLENAENGPRRSEVTHLLEELKDATHDAENVLDMVSTEALFWNEKQQQVRFFPCAASKWIFRWKNRSTIDSINKIMETFISIHKRFLAIDNLSKHVIGKSSSKETKKENPTVGPVLQSEVFGRVEEKNKIIDMLKSDRHSVEGRVFWTPITGMGGIGKTTLAQQVYKDGEVTQHFDQKIWIPVSNGSWVNNSDRILKAINAACAKHILQASLEEIVEHSVIDLKLPIVLDDVGSKAACGKDLLQGSLEENVEHSVIGLKLLIVLDDVWSEDLRDWKNIEKVLLKADKRTRVIVTSRSLNVFGLSPNNVPIPNTQLEVLPDKDCLALFAKNAIDGDVSTLESKGVKQIADQIVQKCGGLPLAVEVIGCLLRTKPLEEWSDILNYDLAKFEEDESSDKEHHRTLPVLRLSYFHLSPRLKQCFSFCSIFPKGHLFDIDELVKFWMAHSLIKLSKLGQRLEDKGRKYFDRLRVLSFFQQQPNSEKYRMHDYMHDLAILVSGKYSCIVREENNEIDPQTHHVSYICEKMEGATQVMKRCTKLRTFLMPQSYHSLTNFSKTVGKMLQAVKYLRVLDLSSSRLSQLPKTVGELKLLCYLNLSRTKIKSLPKALCGLQNLQTLKLLECPWFSQLPRGLSRLIKLHYLEIDEAFWKFRCSSQTPRIGRLTFLHNLQKFRVGESKKGSGIEELKGMKYLEGSLHIMELNNVVNAAEASLKDKPKLQVLELEWASDRDLEQLPSKPLVDNDAQVLEDLEPHSSLIELKIYKYCGKTTPSWLSRGQLEYLKILVLEGCKNLEALTLGSHPNLEILCIKNMQKLRKLPAELKCPSLHTLKISKCPNLIQLPESIPKLQLLKIKRCSSLKAIPPLVYSGTLELVDNLVLEGFHDDSLGGLYDLGAIISRCKIIGCPSFHGFPAKYNSSKAYINRKLEIGQCESIRIDPDRPLTELAIDTCHKDAFLQAMTFISEFDFSILNDSHVSILYLQSLTISNILSLISFPTNWEVKLVSLYVRACKDLEALFDSTESCKTCFPSLVNLSIHDCPKLSKFPEEGLPPKLELLIIHSCPNLESLGSPEVLRDLHSLVDIYIEDCPKLQSFPALGFPSSMQHLRIHGCPQLTEKCKTENGNGPDWPKIMNIPYLEIEEAQSPSSQYFSCFKGESSSM